MVEPLVLKQKRDPVERHQVRFWSNESLYRQFREEMDRQDIGYGDAFNQFMEWAIRDRPSTTPIVEESRNEEKVPELLCPKCGKDARQMNDACPNPGWAT